MRSRTFAFLTTLLITLAACGVTATQPQPSPSSSAAAFPTTVMDFQQQPVTIAKRPERLVSIGPSITAFLFALGAGPRVVGVDDFSDEPAEATKLDKVGGVKVNFEK